MADISIEIANLEERLKAIENQIGVNNSQESNEEKEILSSLKDVQHNLSAATTGREKIHRLWKRLDELNDLFNPQITDKLTLTDDVKVDIILGEEQHLKDEAELLGQVDEMKALLDSEHIKAVPGMSDRLQPLGLVQIEQLNQVQNVSDDIKQLLEAYNNMITLVSKQFIQWEDTITKMEIAKKIRKGEEVI